MLPPATERLWQRLQNEPLLAGWYLIGGTALSLRIAHRVSEDLDFAWPQGNKLPRPVLDALVRSLGNDGWHLERSDNAAAYEAFLLAGSNLHDYQQDFLAISDIGKVKLTFFSPEQPLSTILPASVAPVPVVPPLSLLFQCKAIAACGRSTVRDWVDLHALMTQHGFSMDDFVAAYQAAGAGLQLDLAFQRLASGQPRTGDPGVEGLMPHPPTVAELAEFFRAEIVRWKSQRAATAWSAQPTTSGPHLP
jgi:hypothetical protein